MKKIIFLVVATLLTLIVTSCKKEDWIEKITNPAIDYVSTSYGKITVYHNVGEGAYGLAVDQSNNVWVPNSFKKNITKITPDNQMITYNIGKTSYGVVSDGKNIFLANQYEENAMKMDPNGNTITTYKNVGDNPWGIILNKGNILTANYDGNDVTQIDPDGKKISYLVGANPSALTSDGLNIYTANSGDSSVSKITPEGIIKYDHIGIQPISIAADNKGNAWVADYVGNRVYKISATGIISSCYIGPVGPHAITYDSINNCAWTANYYNSLSRVSDDMILTTYNGITGNGITGHPWAITLGKPDGDYTIIWVAGFITVDTGIVSKISIINKK